MATNTALETAELLEMILLQLAVRDVLISQRVSRQWASAIKSSINIQRALFLKPMDGPEPYEQEQMNPSAVTLEMPCADILATPGPKTVFQSVLSLTDNAGIITKFKVIPEDSKMAFPDASWQKMLLIQPPTPKLWFLSNWRRGLPPNFSLQDYADRDSLLEAATRSIGSFTVSGEPHATIFGFVEQASWDLRCCERPSQKDAEHKIALKSHYRLGEIAAEFMGDRVERESGNLLPPHLRRSSNRRPTTPAP